MRGNKYVNYQHEVCQVCVYIYIYNFVVLGLKIRVVTLGIRALGLDPEDH